MAGENPVVVAIIAGEHDADLGAIEQAIYNRKRRMFRPGTRVRVSGTTSAKIEGKEGVVVRINPKRIAVGFGEKGEFGYESQWNIPASMLEPIS